MSRVLSAFLAIALPFVIAAGCSDQAKVPANADDSASTVAVKVAGEDPPAEPAKTDADNGGVSAAPAGSSSDVTNGNEDKVAIAEVPKKQSGKLPNDNTASNKASINDDSHQDASDDKQSEKPAEEDGYVVREENVRKSFAAPPESKALTRDSSLWVDRKRQRVYLDGYVAMQRGSLEMFACPVGTKEHESIIATLAKSREVHAALLAIKAMPGTPVQYVPEFVPATGQLIRVWICWRDKDNKFQVTDARKWIRKNGTKDEMKAEWVFAGSSIWKDPSDGRDYYQADGGDMICVSNFSTAMMDVTISSSAEADALQFEPYEERIPELGTPVRIVLVPIPNPTDAPNAEPKLKHNDPPTAEVLPASKTSAASDAASQPEQPEQPE